MDAGVELAKSDSGRRRFRTIAEKRQIVEQTLSSSMSVASLARQHGVNANRVFYWRKLYRAGQFGGEIGAESIVRLLPVRVDSDEAADPGYTNNPTGTNYRAGHTRDDFGPSWSTLRRLGHREEIAEWAQNRASRIEQPGQRLLKLGDWDLRCMTPG